MESHKQARLINRVGDILVPKSTYNGMLKRPLKLKTNSRKMNAQDEVEKALSI